jgi:thioredoxin 1
LADAVWVESEEDFAEEISVEGRAVALFTAPSWCVPCQRFEPHFKRAQGNEDDIKFVAVDLDKNPWASVEYGVQSVPTCWLYENGVKVRSIKVPVSALLFLSDIRS